MQTKSIKFQLSKEVHGNMISTGVGTFSPSKEICVQPPTTAGEGMDAHCFNQLMLIPLKINKRKRALIQQ
jgi:hypothetical protein